MSSDDLEIDVSGPSFIFEYLDYDGATREEARRLYALTAAHDFTVDTGGQAKDLLPLAHDIEHWLKTGEVQRTVSMRSGGKT